MTLNTNEVRMVDLLFDCECVVAEVADKMNVSARQIRNYVSNINYYIGDAVEIKKGEIKLNLSPKQFSEKIRDIPVSHYRAMAEERQSFILDSYLFLNTNQYSDYEEQLHISRPTLKKDLHYLSTQLYASGLLVELEDGQFTICGTEKKIRHLMMERISCRVSNIYPSLSFNIINSPIEFAIQGVIDAMLKKLPLNNIYSVVTKIASSISQQYSHHFFKLIFIYLSVSLIRIEKQHYITTKNNECYLRQSSAIKNVCQHLYDLIDCDLEYEHLHLAEYFFSGCLDGVFTEFQSSISFFSYFTVKKIETIQSIEREQAEQLYQQICFYLPSAIYRMKNHINLSADMRENNQAYQWLIALSQKWLPESFRDEELYQISQLIEATLAQAVTPKMSLTLLLKTIEDHVTGMNKPSLAQALNDNFSFLLDDDLSLYNDSNFIIRAREISNKQPSDEELAEEVMQIMVVEESERVEMQHYLQQRISDLSIYSKITDHCDLFCLHSVETALYRIDHNYENQRHSYFFYASQHNTIPMAVIESIVQMC